MIERARFDCPSLFLEAWRGAHIHACATTCCFNNADIQTTFYVRTYRLTCIDILICYRLNHTAVQPALSPFVLFLIHMCARLRVHRRCYRNIHISRDLQFDFASLRRSSVHASSISCRGDVQWRQSWTLFVNFFRYVMKLGQVIKVLARIYVLHVIV